METIRSVTFSSTVSGPSLLCFGAIHGRETCGSYALRRVEKELSSGVLELVRGSITMVPVCNPKAYAGGLRYCEQNLNRVFKKTSAPKSYEARLANKLCPLVDQCDFFLDLHSFSPKGKPFVILDYDDKTNAAFARSLGQSNAVVGWPEAYEKIQAGSLGYDTTAYAHANGKVGVLIECGRHKDIAAREVAYRAVVGAMQHLGLIQGKPKEITFSKMRITHVFFRNSEKDVFEKTWHNFSPVAKGEIIGTRADGSDMVALEDAFVFFPKPESKVGDEWFYLVKEVKSH